MIEPVATPHLDAYVPERRKAVTQLRLVVSNASSPNPDQPEQAQERVKTFRESAQRLRATLNRLEELARTSGIDFEATIYELAVEEQQQLRETLALSAHQEDTAEITAINREVYEAYKRCRQNLERLRDARLAEYAAVWADHLAALESTVAPPLAQAVREMWTEVADELWVPEASPRGESFLMVWDRGKHHLQIEVFSDGTYDWFYRDRSDNTYQAQEGVPARRFPSTLLAAIRKTRKG